MATREDVKLKAQLIRSTKLDLPWDAFITSSGLTEKAYLRFRIAVEQEGRCEDCDAYEWRDHPIPLELEHIDGDTSNDARSNLKMICCNCHALTSTWRGRNKKKSELRGKKVSDEEMIEALRKYPSIRQALISLGMAGKGNNYRRAHALQTTGR